LEPEIAIGLTDASSTTKISGVKPAWAPKVSEETFVSRDDQAVLSITEAAQFMGVSANSMKRAIARGDIPFIRLGVRVLVPRVGLENYIERSLASAGGNLATAQK
jgi:excisionase family DNA binding protein